MTRDELIALLSEPFYDNFADTVAARVMGEDAVELLYRTVVAPSEGLSRQVQHKVFFRGAYVLERISFAAPDRFEPFVETFCNRDFVACTDPSARRHFTKIMAHLLYGGLQPVAASLDAIAESAAQWAVEPGTKAAVRIWAVEVLTCCRERVDWVAESWDDILGMMAQDAPPSIMNRLRKCWRN